MAKPTPFPRRTSSAIVSDDLTGWQDRAYVATGDPYIAANYFFSQPNAIRIYGQELGFWETNPMAEQSPGARSGRVTLPPYTGLPPNTFVRVVSTCEWNFADFGASGKPVGMYVGDTLFEPNTTPSGTSPGNMGECVGYGVTSSGGTLSIGFGVEGIGPPSLDILITFDSVEISTPAAELLDIIIDSAVAWQMGNPTSITRGSLTFEPNEEWENYPFPGKTMAVVGLDEVVRSRPVIKGSMMLTGEDQFSMYRPGGSWADGASAGGVSAGDVYDIRTFTPGAFRSTLGAGSYLENFIVIWKRLRGDYVAVEFPVALCTHYGIGSQDGDEGLVPVEFEARQENAGTPTASVPYLIHILPSTFEIGA